MTAHNPPTADRTIFGRWLLLVGVAIIFMFLGALWLFSLLPGVDATALYAPLFTHLGGMIAVAVSITAFVVAWRGIAPAVRAYYDPARKEDRATLQRLISERDSAKEAALLAETDLQNALGHVEVWHQLITGDYRALYPDDVTSPAPDAMLRTMRTEILITRPSVERLERVVRERDDLRTCLADHLNQPVPVALTWADLLPLVQVAAGGVKVGALRDAIRKVVPIPEGEYDRFSSAVRALPAYSPTRQGKKPAPLSSVNTPISTPSASSDGRSHTLTDGQGASRTLRTARTRTKPKPHAARVRAQEVNV